MPDLVNQPTSTPTRKVGVGVAAYGGTSSAATVALVMWSMAKWYGGAELIPQDDLVIAPVFASLLTTIINFVCGWLTKERAE